MIDVDRTLSARTCYDNAASHAASKTVCLSAAKPAAPPGLQFLQRLSIDPFITSRICLSGLHRHQWSQIVKRFEFGLTVVVDQELNERGGDQVCIGAATSLSVGSVGRKCAVQFNTVAEKNSP